MSDAKERAAARRQAILASKSDRLAKLTAKAKNEGDVAGNVRETIDDPPLAELPSRPQDPLARREVSKTPERSWNANVDPTSFEPVEPLQLDQLKALQTFLGSRSREGTPLLSSPSPFERGSSPFLPPENIFGTSQPPMQPTRKTLVEKLFPLLHVLSTIIFVWFTLWRTGGLGVDQISSTEYWKRWAELQYSPPSFGWSGEHKHVLWTYLGLQFFLHSLRLLLSPTAPQLPFILSLVVPHLPPPLPVSIQTGYRYIQMFSLLLDDLFVFIVCMGIVVFASAWLTSVS
ncbi:hypothetical protein PIIN_02467 [Serendipita indica DSM 11827]|uniref:Uncharacterized protein n=1 Tax=Serendipita indica (strain DSM 11827) TaxID=1109443 RepID=G4TBA3_SERID|nr:hypothetical protein PIIN_02467 [Serendipita indica DSM 11827]